MHNEEESKARREMTFPESVTQFKKSHLWVALSLIALGFGGGMWFQHEIIDPLLHQTLAYETGPSTPSPTSPVTILPTQARTTIDEPAPEPPSSTQLRDRSLAQPLSDRARAAVDFARQFDALSDANKVKFAEKAQGTDVDWDVEVDSTAYYSKNGEYSFTIAPILGDEKLKDYVSWRVVPSDEHSKRLAGTLHPESIVRVRGSIVRMNGEVGFLRIQGKVDLP
jgi:hypothetical protein